jgi:hypothetical protein
LMSSQSLHEVADNAKAAPIINDLYNFIVVKF